MDRDAVFNQAVTRAKEKDYGAARAILRNLLYKYPEDIDALLLYSIVLENKTHSIQALKQILKLDPDHEIAFAQLAKLKSAPPSYIPSPTAPPRIPIPTLAPKPEPYTEAKTKPHENIRINVDRVDGKNKKRKGLLDTVLIGVLILICLIISYAGFRAIALLFNTGL